MKKKIKWNKFLGLGLVFPLSAIATISAGCWDKETTKEEKSADNQNKQITDVSKISGLVNERKSEIMAAKADANKHFGLNMAIVAADGTVNDNSFNQSSWEAIQQLGALTGGEITSVDSSTAELEGKYSSLANTNKNVWVLSGFQHGDAITNWLKVPENKQLFTEKNIIILGIDWTDTENVIPTGRYINLTYKTEEAGWLAGYANASFLAKKFPSDPTKRSAIVIGGGISPAVTDFIAGYLAGIKAWNLKNSDKKTKITTDKIEINLGFKVQDTSTKERLEQIASKDKPSTLLAVAGPLTEIFSDIIANQNDRYLIGVDTDQSLVYTKTKNKFFTSILKNLGYSVFSVLSDLYTKKSNSRNLAGFEFGKKSATVYLGIKDKFVDIADTSLEGNDKKLATEAISEAKKEFEEKTKTTPAEEVRKTLEIPEMTDKQPDKQPDKQQESLDKLITDINKN
ncbi:BMP family ABC transporter substrate-binding protein [Mesomycoplasma hyopneumoniae]|uniref:BMP family ABC transporter substrate-binding protein n=1 Tax=Mesomycoplasma hyopneumoniae TaxID=2099 RepID=UPI001368FD2D|nr:BMP family ABC transporter substrate-binding protein [Mesomycoplasma hyopneumoniae]MXR33922.1 BMP family ABC transporter substrate-binding protein [Mesomycoplasma hyopneumoniae]MXR44273.1 BMP family ABC transporter substrate-binding protein [Mesomycoplasma hyopneumoniae]